MSNDTLDAVRDRILSGVLGADSWIKQDVLAAELGISKIPLREALRKLEQEGLVKSEANRGFFVRPIIAAEAEDIFALRLKIEPEAVLQAAMAAGAFDQSVAVTAHAKLEQAIQDHSPDVPKLNRAFHMALVAPADRLITADIVKRLHIMAERYVRIHLEPIERGDRANREHQDMLDCWLARDAAVEKLAHTHIAETLEDLREQLQ
jgi:DNA-binding GntR family transcriptional regulator